MRKLMLLVLALSCVATAGWAQCGGEERWAIKMAADPGAAQINSTHTDRLSRRVTLPATASAISLTFYMHVDTEEESPTAYDKLRVRIRDSNGQFLATLKTFSNVDAANGFTLHSIDLTQYKGRTIRIELEAVEDNGSSTSFVVDDFVITIEN